MLQDRFGLRGFSVLAFPCNQFGHQEPGSDTEIRGFCEVNYRPTFPLFAKIEVNGPRAHPLFAWLKEKKGGVLGSAIKWNFTKFLIGPDGTVLDRFRLPPAPRPSHLGSPARCWARRPRPRRHSARRLIRSFFKAPSIAYTADRWSNAISGGGPGWLAERFPTEVRATAAGFVYHQGAVWGAAVAPLLTYFAVNQQMGFAKPMMYGTVGSLIVYVIAVYLGPETKGKVLTANLEVIAPAV